MQPILKPEQLPVLSGLGGAEILQGLGLSGRQARVYLATLRLGGGRVQSIADLSGVSRQEIYRLMDDLLERGFVLKNLSNPTTFVAAPIAVVAEVLLRQKSAELEGLSVQMRQLTEKFAQHSSVGDLGAGLRVCFGTISEADRGKKYANALKSAQSCFEAVLSWRRFKQINIHYQEQLQEALEHGLGVRIVTEKPARHHLPKWIPAAIRDYSNFKLKTLAAPPEVAVSVFDGRSADIAFDPNSSLTKGPDLWTTTPSLLALCREYVNTTWGQARPYRHW